MKRPVTPQPQLALAIPDPPPDLFLPLSPAYVSPCYFDDSVASSCDCLEYKLPCAASQWQVCAPSSSRGSQFCTSSPNPRAAQIMSVMPAPSSQYASYAFADGQSFHPTVQSGIHNMQALDLPPIRSAEGATQAPQVPQLQSSQQLQQQQHGHVPTHPQYYPVPPQPYPPQPGDMMRYGGIPIPPADSRIMSGGRHKREIKRRTKTGCLTCRKRRIKVRIHPALLPQCVACCAHPSLLHHRRRDRGCQRVELSSSKICCRVAFLVAIG